MSESTNQLRVCFATPERTLFEGDATAVELPSKSGYLEVLYGHAALMAELGAGDVRIHTGAGLESASADTIRYNVSWGFVEVLPDHVTILANDALKPEEIDVPRAEQQRKRGENMWGEAGESEEAYDEASRIISEANAKITSAAEAGKH